MYLMIFMFLIFFVIYWVCDVLMLVDLVINYFMVRVFENYFLKYFKREICSLKLG